MGPCDCDNLKWIKAGVTRDRCTLRIFIFIIFSTAEVAERKVRAEVAMSDAVFPVLLQELGKPREICQDSP